MIRIKVKDGKMDVSLQTPKRWCYWVSESQDPSDHGGYVPSLVTEGEPGHSPMLGRGAGSAPWVWGKTMAEAQAICKKVNHELGMDEKTVSEIVSSSMFAKREFTNS